jgi:NADH-quinone oxidoreductase subunit M
LNPQGVSGAVLQMVNHGVSTGALFILVGMIYERRHVRDLEAFGGLAKVMPIFAAFFVIATMSSVGLPGLNGFVGEFLILLGAFASLPWAAVIATTGVILSAVYMLWAVRRVFFGPLTIEANKVLSDLGLREKVVAVALVIPMVWIGIHPSTFTNPMDRAVTELLETMTRRGADLAAWQNGGAPPDAPRPTLVAGEETAR